MLTHTFPTPDPVRLDVKLASGEVRVTTDEVTEATVTVDGDERALETVRVELVGDRLVVEPRKEGWLGMLARKGDSLRVEAHLPHRSSVEVATASAETTLEGSFDRVSLKSASGDLTVRGESHGDLDAATASGDVRVDTVHGTLTVHSVSGDVSAQRVGGGVSVNSVSGDVRVASIVQGSARVKSVSGDTELGIAPGSRVEVSASTASGDLSSEIPLAPAPGEGDGPTVVVRGSSVSGDFRIVRALAEPSPV